MAASTRCWPPMWMPLEGRRDAGTPRRMTSRVSHDPSLVRPATVADIPALFVVRTSVNENHLDLEELADRGVTPDSIAAMLADDDMRTWVIEERGEVAGFTMADARTGTVYALFVRP